MIDTILFDCEGVVVDSEPIWDACQTEFLSRRGRVYDRAATKSQITGQSTLESTRTLQQLYALEGDVESLARERLAIVGQLLAGEVGLVSGFAEFFDRVRSSYRTALATAMAPELLAIVDRRLGLAKIFGDRVYDIETVGCRSKPHPDIFLHAADQLGSDPANCVVIEDAPHGIEAARRAGMTSVGLATTWSRAALATADLVVDSFEEISLPLARAGPAV